MFHFFRKSVRVNFKFHEPESSACVACEHVLKKKKPILYVTHDKDDGSWQFLCGNEQHAKSSLTIISLEKACKIDPSINLLYEIPIGFGAERKSSKEDWSTFKMKPKFSVF